MNYVFSIILRIIFVSPSLSLCFTFDIKAKFYRRESEVLSNTYRTSIEHLSNIYRTPIEESMQNYVIPAPAYFVIFAGKLVSKEKKEELELGEKCPAPIILFKNCLFLKHIEIVFA